MRDKIYEYFYQSKNLTEYEIHDPEEIEVIINKFQAGNDDASYSLITQMLPYLNKYFHIIRYGAVNTKDRDTIKFIKLFIADKNIGHKLQSGKFDRHSLKAIYNTLNVIRTNYRMLDDDDIIQELIAALLTLARRYKKKYKNINFCGYVYNAYKYQIFLNLKKITADVTNFTNNLSYNDPDNIDKILEYKELISEDDISSAIFADQGELDNAWCMGKCDDVFKELSPLERTFIKLHYYDKKGYSLIARETGFDRRAIKKHCTKAVDKIKGKLNETNLY